MYNFQARGVERQRARWTIALLNGHLRVGA